MDAFETALKRGFAEAREPADDGFSLRVAGAVSRREQAAKLLNIAQIVGFCAAGASLGYALVQLVRAFGPQVLATLGLEVARAHGVLTSADASITFGVAGLTQMLVIFGALAGGAAVYRATQD